MLTISTTSCFAATTGADCCGAGSAGAAIGLEDLFGFVIMQYAWIARTHKHSALHAIEDFATTSGVDSGLSMNVPSLLSVSALTLSLSKFKRSDKNVGFASSRFH